MAQLKDLIVNGASRLIGDAFANKIQITTINAPTSAGGTTYGAGTSGQVLKTNGTSIYWGADSNSVTGVKGNSESSYRTGNVNITATNIGLGNVENTALSTWAGSANITTLGTISTGTVPLANVSNADDLKAIEALSGTSGLLKKTAANTWTLDTTAYTTNTGTVTKVTAGTGLSIGTTAGGNFTTTGTINHTNSVTAQTTQGLYPIKIDAQGHISAYGSEITALPASDVSDWAKASTKPSYTASEVGLGNVSNNTNLNNTTGAKGDIIYWSAANTPAHLTNTSSTTKKFLSITSQVPSWTTLSNSDVGLGNVENTALSTWAGSTNITTLGTISTGTVPLSNTSGTLPINRGGTGATTVGGAVANLGLSNALHFIGMSATTLTDNDTTNPISVYDANDTVVSHTCSSGDVVIYDSNEFLWTGSQWERLGRDSSFKITQSSVSDPTASGTSTSFISSLSQNANGEITVAKANLPTATTATAGITTVGASGGAATYEHTHTTSIAEDTGTSNVSLTHGSKYKLTAGGTSVVFTMPSDNNTDTLVKQTAKSDNVNYKLLFNTTASPTSGTAYEAYYDTGITVNPSTDTITATNFAGNATTATTATTISTTLPINKGGTNATTALAARQNLRVFYGDDIGNISSPTEGDVALIYYTGTYPGGSSGGGGSSGVTSVRVRATAPVNSSQSTAQTNTLDTTISLNSGYGDTQNPYASKTANYVLAAPNGSAGAPTFRALVAADTPAVLPLTGGTLSGNITVNNTSSEARVAATGAAGSIYFYSQASSSGTYGIYGTNASSTGTYVIAVNQSNEVWIKNAIKCTDSIVHLSKSSGSPEMRVTRSDTGVSCGLMVGSGGTNRGLYDNVLSKWIIYSDGTDARTQLKLYGAVWNDYAEYREANSIESGRCIIEVGDDTLVLSTERMQPGAEIISDTFGFAIGQTEKAQTPIAASGRVLAYPYEDKEEFRKNIGKPVCSGPNGTVSIMTDEEYATKGYCAIGTISAVPDYETWGENDIAVNGRVWIRVR